MANKTAENKSPKSADAKTPAEVAPAAPAAPPEPASPATLTGKAVPEYKSFADDQIAIPTDKKDPLYDPRGVEAPDADMVDSIVTDGFMEEKVVSVGIVTDAAGKVLNPKAPPVVLGGHRRIIALRAANKMREASKKPAIKVPCVVYSGTPAQLYEIIMRSNSGAKAEGELLRSERFAKLKLGGYRTADIARKAHVSVDVVEQGIKVHGAIADLKKAFADGKINWRTTVRIARLDKAKQAEALATELDRGAKGGTDGEGEGAGSDKAGNTTAKPASKAEARTLLDMYRQGLEAGLPAILTPDAANLLMWVVEGRLDDDMRQILRAAEGIPAMIVQVKERAAANAQKTRDATSAPMAGDKAPLAVVPPAK